MLSAPPSTLLMMRQWNNEKEFHENLKTLPCTGAIAQFDNRRNALSVFIFLNIPI